MVLLFNKTGTGIFEILTTISLNLTEQCKDIDAARCEIARKGGYCENYKLKANVSKQCPKSCGVCGMCVFYKRK